MGEEAKKRKQFYVDAEFPELPGGKMRQVWRGEATTIKIAPFKALQEIMVRPGVKGRSIHKIKLTIIEMGDSTGE